MERGGMLIKQIFADLIFSGICKRVYGLQHMVSCLLQADLE